jgi:glutathione synthase/RimK-type ligase-like ATP-grasp enzyme
MRAVLCLASYEKGHDFLREARRQGWQVLLLTSLSLQNKAAWPMESVDEIFYMPDEHHVWDRTATLNAVSFLARSRNIERVVALEDFDVEVAAMLREHLRVPGLGDSGARFFRDKLAMRIRAREAGLAVPAFCGIINHKKISEFLEQGPGPWVLKPRSMAGALGIKKLVNREELWPILDSLGDAQSNYLIESFVSGPVCHVDSVVSKGRVVFAVASQYGRPPMETSHDGGIFSTRILDRDSELAKELVRQNALVLAAMGLECGVSHTEFILGPESGEVFFLETSCRVGGAFIAELVQAATGLNLWAEWAKVELADAYPAPVSENNYAGLLISLARQEKPDTSAYSDPEIGWRLDLAHHVGLLVKSPSLSRVDQLMSEYGQRIETDFHASLPPQERPTS